MDKVQEGEWKDVFHGKLDTFVRSDLWYDTIGSVKEMVWVQWNYD